MHFQEIVQRVQQLELPVGSYVVFGSCPMAAAGSRECQDIDLLISEDLDAELLQKGWTRHEGKAGDRHLENDVFDAHTNWHIHDYDTTIEKLLQDATYIDGIPFASLQDVRGWKSELARPKDLQDIRLIDDYLAGHK